MTRLHLVVEGQTEEAFARDLLTPHLATPRVFCDARLPCSRRDAITEPLSEISHQSLDRGRRSPRSAPAERPAHLPLLPRTRPRD